jgi:hypothetical protein
MARGITDPDAAWMRKSILVMYGKPRSRRLWPYWMRRALAPHEREMAIPHRPIAAIDIEPGAREAEATLTNPF